MMGLEQATGENRLNWFASCEGAWLSGDQYAVWTGLRDVDWFGVWVKVGSGRKAVRSERRSGDVMML